jgi:WD40 repeat protein
MSGGRTSSVGKTKETFFSRLYTRTKTGLLDNDDDKPAEIVIKSSKTHLVSTDLSNRSQQLDTTLLHVFKEDGIKFKSCHVNECVGMVAFGGSDKKVTVRDTHSGEKKFECEHKDEIRVCRFSKDGEFLASSGDDNIVKVWSCKSGKLESEYDHGKAVQTVSWSPDGLVLASGGYDEAIRIWKPQSKDMAVADLKQDSVCEVSIFSSNGEWFVCGGGSGGVNGFYIRMYDVFTTGESDHKYFQEVVTFRLSNFVYALEFSPDCKRFVHGGGDKMITVRDVETFAILQQFDSAGVVYDASFSFDGKYLAMAAKDCNLIVRDVESGAVIASYDSGTAKNKKGEEIKDGTRTCAFSPNEKDPSNLLLVSGGYTVGEVTIRDLRTGIVKQTFEHDKEVLCLEFSLDGRFPTLPPHTVTTTLPPLLSHHHYP